MSFRSSEGSQHRDAGAAATKAVAYLMSNGAGGYTINATGPAVAYLSSNGSGGFIIDPSASSHAAGVRLLKIGSPFRIVT